MLRNKIEIYLMIISLHDMRAWYDKEVNIILVMIIVSSCFEIFLCLAIFIVLSTSFKIKIFLFPKK